MVEAARANPRAHSTTHKLLRLWIDHAVLFRKQKPGRLRLPSRRRRCLLNATNRNWSLHCGQDADLIGQLLTVNMRSYLPGDLLVKTDRMTMANSLEARCPFLDQQLLEFACAIPSQLKLRGMTTKYILKRALKDIVPQEIIDRKKHGFGVPVGQWFRTTLKSYLHETLLSREALARGYFHEATLRRLIAEHESGKRDHGHRLWSLLTFEIWHRIFIEQDKSSWLAETSKTESRSFASSAG